MITKVKTSLIAFSLCAAFAGARSLEATTIVDSTYTTWKSDVSGQIELDFTGVNQTKNYSDSSGVTLKPVSGPALPFNFTGPLTGGGYQLNGGSFGPIQSLVGPAAGAGQIYITLPNTGVNAFLIGLGAGGSAGTVNVALSDGQSFNVAASTSTTAFLGLSISHNVTWISVTGTSQVYIDDFFYASSKLMQDPPSSGQDPSATVEGSSLFLMGGGLFALALARRKLVPALRLA